MAWPRANVPLIASLATTALCAGLYAAHRSGVLEIPGLENAELGTLDARFRLRGPRAPRGDDIVIVALDEATRAGAPDIVQKRAGWARLIAAIGRAGPAAIGIDGFFAAPEAVLPPAVIGKVRAAEAALAGDPGPGAQLAREALAAVLEETRGDELLAQAVAAARVVELGALLFVDEEPAPDGAGEPPGLAGARAGEVAVAETHPSRRPPRAGTRVVAPLPEIAAGAHGAGLLNVIHDDDGAVRRAFTLVERGGRFYLPLGLAVARARLPAGAGVSYVTGDTRLGFGPERLAVDARARAQLDFLGPSRTFRHLPALDVITGRVPAEALAGKLVFVGYTDAARDKLTTPFDPLMAGVEVHATLAHNALHGELLERAGPRGTLAAIAGLGVLLGLLQLRVVRARHPWLVGLLAAALIAGYLAVAQWLFGSQRVVIDVAAPLLSFTLIGAAAVMTALVVEGREKARIRAAFSQYLDDKAVKEILADPSRLELGGERRELTVLFSDIRGFTQLSEDLEPEQVITFLNQYLTPMTELVWSEGGMLDKYIGDAVMAVFGAPLDHADHARRACRAALSMQKRLAELNTAWAKAGLPRIAVGIGLNSGPMSVGNMGSVRRKNYTVVGDAVNVGARLEAMTKTYGVEILVGERTKALAADDFPFRELDLVRARGRDRAERVFELITDDRVDVAAYAIALGCYRRKEWDAAEKAFARLHAEHPEDRPAAVLYERVRRLRQTPPPDDWDGVYDAS